MKRQNGHFWLPFARRVEASVKPVMVAPMEGAAEGQDVDEKMDEQLPVEERSAHESTHMPFRDWCPHCVSCRASDPGHRLTERAADRLPVCFGEGEHGSQR